MGLGEPGGVYNSWPFKWSSKKHPGKRLTTPDDVGRAIVALSAPGMNWVTGNTITIDGGEQIAGG